MSLIHTLATKTVRRAAGRLTALSVAVAAFAAAVAPAPAAAQSAGDLVVAPTRVVFEDRTRSAQLGLVNRGSETATYRITVVNMRMMPDGRMVEIAEPDPGQAFADTLFRYSPRQVTLEPGASQAIRLLLRKPKDLADGEYRSHLMMRAVPTEGDQSVEQSGEGATVRLIPVFGIAVPVIVRHGEVSYDASVTSPQFQPPEGDGDLPGVRFELERSGNSSAFGDLTVSVDDGGERVVLSQIMRLAVYTPNTSRTVVMPLRVPQGLSLSGKTLTISYAETADDGGAPIAETTLTVP
jgi:P pilus assembly chaperone PapD